MFWINLLLQVQLFFVVLLQIFLNFFLQVVALNETIKTAFTLGL